MALFVSSFLVLFLETALIRWMPAYVRLLAYFSNFILLASFLGIGVGCLLATRRRNLIVWFPLIQFSVILAVDLLRLEVALPDMLPKAYRWVAEMREISGFLGADHPASQIYEGFARWFEHLAEDAKGEAADASLMKAFAASIAQKKA